MTSPGFWDRHAEAKKKSETLAEWKRKLARFESLERDSTALGELADQLTAVKTDGTGQHAELEVTVREIESTIRALEIETRFTGKYDRGNAVVAIYSGAGGKDAEDWAAMLRRMYERWAERGGYRVRTLHEHWGELEGPSGWGIKNISISIQGEYAYGNIKKESGVHRLVRISPFSAKSLRHTSFALVEVMPEFVLPEEVTIKPEEIEIEFFRSSGPGGQNVNKRETAVRITHRPTKISVAVQIERTQERNREIAMQLLAARLYQERLREQEREAKRLRGEAVSVEWGSQIRSYVLHPYQLVKDHRTNYETAKIDSVLDGDLTGFIEAELDIDI